jgi:acyl carrier protein
MRDDSDLRSAVDAIVKATDGAWELRGDPWRVARLQALLAEAIQAPPELVTPDLAFGDLPQWDSLGHMEVMLRLEEQYGVAIDADIIAQLVSVPEICRYLEAYGHAQ